MCSKVIVTPDDIKDTRAYMGYELQRFERIDRKSGESIRRVLYSHDHLVGRLQGEVRLLRKMLTPDPVPTPTQESDGHCV